MVTQSLLHLKPTGILRLPVQLVVGVGDRLALTVLDAGGLAISIAGGRRRTEQGLQNRKRKTVKKLAPSADETVASRRARAGLSATHRNSRPQGHQPKTVLPYHCPPYGQSRTLQADKDTRTLSTPRSYGDNPMMCLRVQGQGSTRWPANRQRGFTMIELSVVMLAGLVLSAIAIPMMQSAVRVYRLRSSVASITGAIQSTRYRAIYQGIPYRIAISKATATFQLLNQPGGAGPFVNVGNPIPIYGSAVAVNQDTTLEFRPSGSVLPVAGATTFTITDNSYPSMPSAKTITVSSYGNIDVTP